MLQLLDFSWPLAKEERRTQSRTRSIVSILLCEDTTRLIETTKCQYLAITFTEYKKSGLDLILSGASLQTITNKQQSLALLPFAEIKWMYLSATVIIRSQIIDCIGTKFSSYQFFDFVLIEEIRRGNNALVTSKIWLDVM